jgi:23S rRNA (uracil1939-C5)-methyltransferase
MRVSPGSFFQVNLALLPAIHERMVTFLGQGRVLVDLYAGVGTHGIALRGGFDRVLFVEGTRSAIADLRSTIRAHGISGADIAPAAVERSLDTIGSVRPDAVVLNPARTGASDAALDAIARSPATRVAYLSCDPGTLARDLDVLSRAGLETVSVQPIDMMPQTRQVEALALLRRRPRRPRGRHTTPKRGKGTLPRRPTGRRRRT